MRTRHALLAFTGAIAATPTWASDAQTWTGLEASGAISGPVVASTDLVARFGDRADGLYQVEATALIGYRFSKDVVLQAGYVFAPDFHDGDQVALEQRAREQLSVAVIRRPRVTIAVRLRAEQRWRDTAPGTGWRLRPHVRVTLPFKAGGKTALYLTSESFVNLNTTGFQRDGYERVRNAFGIAIPLGKSLRLEAGYLNQHGFVPGGGDTSDNVLTTSLSFNW